MKKLNNSCDGLPSPLSPNPHPQGRSPLPPSSSLKPQASYLLLLLLLTAALPSCSVFNSLTGGKGTQDALYTVPEKIEKKPVRVLVLVDPRPASGAPADVPTALGTLLNEHLYQFRVADNFVDQARLTELRKNPRYNDMGIADIARATDADIVIFVDLFHFETVALSGGELTQGYAQATVKAVDRDGKRLWPTPPETQVLGYSIEARVDPALTEQANATAVRNKLLAQLTLAAGRIFHSYERDH